MYCLVPFIYKPERVVARGFSTLRYVCTWVSCCSEILHAWVLCIMCEPERVVARGFFTLRYVRTRVSCCSEILHAWVLCVNLSELLLNLSELLLGDSPRLGFMCELERVVGCCSGFLHTQVCLHLSELLLGVSPHLGFMCELERVVARSFSTLRYVCICCSEFLHTWVLCVNLSYVTRVYILFITARLVT